MFADLLALYDDPLFWLFPIATSAVSMVAFLLFAGPLTWIAVRDPEWARPYRVQKRRPNRKTILWPSVKWWLLNNAVMTALVVLAWPLLRLTGIHAGPMPPWYVVVIQVVFCIFLDDFLYYFVHRAFHEKTWLKPIHMVHHRVPTPWAIAAHYMHPVEFVLTGALTILGPILLGAHVVTLYAYVIFRQWIAAEGHAGYSFPYTISHLFAPVYDGVEYHDFHHSRFEGNYAGFLGYMDSVFGQYARGYEEKVGLQPRG